MALAAQPASGTSTLDATIPQATVPAPAQIEDTKTSHGHSGGPLDSHPTTIVPQRTSSTTATSLRHSLSGAGPITPPRRSSRRYNSVSSGDWFAGGKKSSTGPSPRPSTSQKDNWQTSDFSWTAFTASKTASRRMEHVTEDTKAAVNGTGVSTGLEGRSLKEPATLSVPPPLEPPQDFGDDLIFSTNRTWSARKEKTLLGPFDYMYGHPGKDIRAQLISAFNAWLQVPEESLQVVTKVVGMLHTASLLVDDVEDSSQLRRGIPVSHSIFGVPQTLNSANYVYFLALNELTTLPHSTSCIQIYTDELINLHRGQGMDLFWRDTLTCPTESDYLEMVSNKTGGLFRLAIKLMAAESGLPSLGRKIPNVLPLIQTISLYFQILDDLLNLSSSVYTSRKGLCEDLTEGKFSFPVIHAVRSDPSNTQLLNILRMKTTDEDVKRYAVGYMEQCGSFKYTRAVLAVLEGKVNRFLEQIERDVGGEEGKRGADGIRAIVGKLKSL